MYKEEFLKLVELAFIESKEIYSDPANLNKPNPYFLGFGNPDSDIIIFGQEKAIKKDNVDQINAESIQNPFQWKEIIDNRITDFNHRFIPESVFKNPLHPYDSAPKPTNTWSYYQKLIDLIIQKKANIQINNSFFKFSFITEINHEVSKRSLGNKRDEIRSSVINHNFFKSFPITILATGNYLNIKEIEDKFDVKYSKVESDNQPFKKFSVFTNLDRSRVVINTRQLSNFYFDGGELENYFYKIADKAREFIKIS